MGESLRRLCVRGARPSCDTLVQYAACLFSLLVLGLGGDWYHSIPIILVGVVLHLFFFKVSVFLSSLRRTVFSCPLLICGLRALWGSYALFLFSLRCWVGRS
ncbi:hypothetical protein BDV29DRAFT_184334 [Aspergillus leporis]|uniref:Uncharacterized protein n=1 Tax=Aspergillus leporis TaxID=41062 RepID=A0A5N5WJE3_9EURO|nr:hypothetical protein BDV29DRAFT_184334 [Aspergillus leporis]